MDDFVILDNDKMALLGLREQIARFLDTELGLNLKPTATFLNRRINGLPFLGVRIFPEVIRLKRPSFVSGRRRLRSREREWAAGILNDEDILAVTGSYQGHWGQYDTLRLRQNENMAYDAKWR